MTSTTTRFIAALVIIALAVPAVAQVTEDDVRRARDEVDRIQGNAQTLGDRIQEGWARQFQLEDEIAGLEESINFARIQLAASQKRLEEVAVEMYMASASGLTMMPLIQGSNDGYQAGIEYLRRVSGSDESLINQLRSYQNQLDQQSSRLAEASVEQENLLGELMVMANQLQAELASAQVFYDVLVATKQREDEERRREEERIRREQEELARLAASTTVPATTTTRAVASTTTAPPTTTTTVLATTTTGGGETTTTIPTTTTTTTPLPPSEGGACPVDGPVSFSDSWGAPRSGGRAHQGVDMIAARGTPVVAIYDGFIWRLNPVDTGLGGITIWLQRSNGDRFYYAHLDRLAEISVGQQVVAGQLIGYVGSTGNAQDWLPHLHFEYHPGGGAAVNPYPLVRPLC